MLETLDEARLTAWIAGFYEGEGSISTNINLTGTQRGPGIRWSISQKNLEPLGVVKRWLKDCIGLVATIQSNHQPGMHTISVTSYLDIKEIFQKLRPFLTERREDQFKSALHKFEENSVRYGTKQSTKVPKTHCKYGHEYTEENTYRDPNGWRRCRACHREDRV